MKTLRPLYVVFSFFIVLNLSLSACGVSEEDAYADEYATEEYSTEEPVAEEGGAEPFSTGVPGNLVYDLGFTPQENGFSFSNYGDDIPAINLTAVELRRMFGDQVCARLHGDDCTLTPPAEQWMEQINDGMAGGHCEG